MVHSLNNNKIQVFKNQRHIIRYIKFDTYNVKNQMRKKFKSIHKKWLNIQNVQQQKKRRK